MQGLEKMCGNLNYENFIPFDIAAVGCGVPGSAAPYCGYVDS